MLSQAQSPTSQNHKLEFTVKSAEELDTVMEELNACDSRTTLLNSVSRSGFTKNMHQNLQHKKRYHCQLHIFHPFVRFLYSILESSEPVPFIQFEMFVKLNICPSVYSLPLKLTVLVTCKEFFFIQPPVFSHASSHKVG